MNELGKLLETLKKEGYTIVKHEYSNGFINYEIVNKWNDKKITINHADVQFYAKNPLLEIIHKSIGELTTNQKVLYVIAELLNKGDIVASKDYAMGFDDGWQSGYLESNKECVKMLRDIVKE